VRSIGNAHKVLLIVCGIICAALLTSQSGIKRSTLSWPFPHWSILWTSLLQAWQCRCHFAVLVLFPTPPRMMPKCLSMSLLLPMTSTSWANTTFTRKP
jgi:hypothetical protein